MIEVNTSYATTLSHHNRQKDTCLINPPILNGYTWEPPRWQDFPVIHSRTLIKIRNCSFKIDQIKNELSWAWRRGGHHQLMVASLMKMALTLILVAWAIFMLKIFIVWHTYPSHLLYYHFQNVNKFSVSRYLCLLFYFKK